MYWSNLHYIQNPALRIAEQKNILTSQIESAKLSQAERHHNELLSFQNAKLALEEKLGIKRIEEERQRHEDNMQMQQQQMNNQLSIAHIQANNQLEIQRIQSNLQMQLAMFSHLSLINQQTNQMIMNAMQTILNDIVSENQHQREMEKQLFISKTELIKMKIQNKHTKEMVILSHNLLLVEKRLDSHLKREEIDFDKYSTVFYRLIEKILGLSEDGIKIDNTEKVDKYVDDMFYQMYGERFSKP